LPNTRKEVDFGVGKKLKIFFLNMLALKVSLIKHHGQDRNAFEGYYLKLNNLFSLYPILNIDEIVLQDAYIFLRLSAHFLYPLADYIAQLWVFLLLMSFIFLLIIFSSLLTLTLNNRRKILSTVFAFTIFIS
jgi:hypothetical protein